MPRSFKLSLLFNVIVVVIPVWIQLMQVLNSLFILFSFTIRIAYTVVDALDSTFLIQSWIYYLELCTYNYPIKGCGRQFHLCFS